GLHVIEGDIECCKCLSSDTVPTDRRACSQQGDVFLRDVVGVLADEHLGNFFGMGVLGRTTGTFRVAEAQSFVTLSTLDLSEEEDHFGHRLLPAGEYLGIGDRRGQWERCRRKSDFGDRIRGVHSCSHILYSACADYRWYLKVGESGCFGCRSTLDSCVSGSEEEAEDEHSDQAENREGRRIGGADLEGFADLEVEVLFEHPEPWVIDMAEGDRTACCREDHELGRSTCRGDERCSNSAGGGDCNGG